MSKYFPYIFSFFGVLILVFIGLVVFNVFPNLNKNLSILIYPSGSIVSTGPTYMTYYLSGFKLTVTLPENWSITDDYVGDGTRGADVFNGYIFLKDGTEQFAFAVGDETKLGSIAENPTIWYFEEFEIAGNLERIYMRKEDEEFKEMYAGIDSGRFVITSTQDFNTDMMDIFETITYTNI